jgi:hypothetical protein
MNGLFTLDTEEGGESEEQKDTSRIDNGDKVRYHTGGYILMSVYQQKVG